MSANCHRSLRRFRERIAESIQRITPGKTSPGKVGSVLKALIIRRAEGELQDITPRASEDAETIQ
jgi:hypothetical protein